MLFHGEEVLNNIRKNVLFLINQEIEKWGIEMYTLIRKLGQLSNKLPALAKIVIIFFDYVMWTMKFQQHKLQRQPTSTVRMKSSNVGDGIRDQIFDNSDCSDSATVEAELLGTKSGLTGTVLGHAVARSSWGKSGCECKCCFQINGGLHRSCREAPLDTESLQIPIWYHVNKYKSASSILT
jgi:hypothetical protein